MDEYQAASFVQEKEPLVCKEGSSMLVQVPGAEELQKATQSELNKTQLLSKQFCSVFTADESDTADIQLEGPQYPLMGPLNVTEACLFRFALFVSSSVLLCLCVCHIH